MKGRRMSATSAQLTCSQSPRDSRCGQLSQRSFLRRSAKSGCDILCEYAAPQQRALLALRCSEPPFPKAVAEPISGRSPVVPSQCSRQMIR